MKAMRGSHSQSAGVRTHLASRRAPRRLLALAAITLALTLACGASASEAHASAWWHLSARAAPTQLIAGQKATIVISATNAGDSPVDGTHVPVRITDTLPAGLEATEIRGEPAFHKEVSHLMSCELASLSCTSKPEAFPAFERLEVIITVEVKAGASSGELDQASVFGGEQEGQPGVAVPGVSLQKPLSLGSGPTPFGVEEGGYGLRPEALGGAVERQAGSHPFQLTTTLNFNQVLEANTKTGPTQAAPALAQNLSFALPPGLIGNPQAVPACPATDFLAIRETATNACSSDTAIGVVVVTLDEPNHFGDITRAVPLWNLEAAKGEPARLGFEVLKVPVVLDTSLRSNGDYGVDVSVANAPEAAQILSSEVTIWGNPGDPSHDSSRGWACLLGGVYFNEEVPCQPPAQRPSAAFLTLPTSCTGPLTSTVEGSSWPVKALASEPGEVFSLAGPSTEAPLQGFEDCDQLPFSPSLHLQSEEHAAATPTALNVDVHMPQETTLEASGLGEADLKDTSVTLPEGIELSPSSANGLEACSEAQIGYEGQAAVDPYSPGAEAPLRFSAAEPHCPDASKMGEVHVKTPLLSNELSGSLYLAEPAPQGEAGKNPFGSLLALYITAEDQSSGVRVKLAGEVKLNPNTGQITSTFLDAPQVPFEDFRLHFFGGPRASVATPSLCGDYRSKATFTPWSYPFEQALQSESQPGELAVSEGPGGSACPQTEPFAPTLSAGSQNPQAGAFSSFSLSLERPDGNQPLSALSVHLPQGAAAMLASVSPCGEPQAAQGSCGPASEIGKATASAGVGPDPYTESGRLYITGPYQGAPFGLEIVTPAVAGPFNLGVVVVRSKIEVDPHTAEVTIQGAIPTFLQGVGMPPTGIPLQLKRVHVEVDRPSFEFNPTSCDQKKIEATLSGAGGAQAQLSEPFQVQGCQSLPFKPTLTAQTEGRTSKANGASFLVKVSSTPGQANIAKTVLQVPKILPARLSTIQKACLAKTFEANPASCPEGSNIGQGIAHTPVLRSTLQGPAYLVSHGNAAWPDVEFVLQGEGITLILDGQTAIKGGVTTSSFNTVPDAPVSSFEAILPEGPHSALTTDLPPKAHYSLCGQKLLVPTTLTGQNGAVIKQSTKVSVSGCGAVKAAKAKKLSRAQKLKRALASCRRRYRHSKARRQSCEHKARRRFGPKKGKAKGLGQGVAKTAKGHAQRSSRND